MYALNYYFLVLIFFISIHCLKSSIDFDTSIQKDSLSHMQELLSLLPTETTNNNSLYTSISSYLSTLFQNQEKETSITQCISLSNELLHNHSQMPQPILEQLYKNIARYEFEFLRTATTTTALKSEKSDTEKKDERNIRYIKYGLACMFMYQMTKVTNALIDVMQGDNGKEINLDLDLWGAKIKFITKPDGRPRVAKQRFLEQSVRRLSRPLANFVFGEPEQPISSFSESQQSDPLEVNTPEKGSGRLPKRRAKTPLTAFCNPADTPLESEPTIDLNKPRQQSFSSI